MFYVNAGSKVSSIKTMISCLKLLRTNVNIYRNGQGVVIK